MVTRREMKGADLEENGGEVDEGSVEVEEEGSAGNDGEEEGGDEDMILLLGGSPIDGWANILKNQKK